MRGVAIVDSLPPTIRQRIESTQTSKSVVCHLRALSNETLVQFLAESRKVHDSTGRRPTHDALPVLLQIRRLGRASQDSRPWKRHLFPGSVASLPTELRPDCDIVMIDMEAEDAAARMAMQADLTRVLALGRDSGAAARTSPLVVLYGNATCGPPQAYRAMGWLSARATCWNESWHQLTCGGDVYDEACVDDPDGRTRWCAAAARRAAPMRASGARSVPTLATALAQHVRL